LRGNFPILQEFLRFIIENELDGHPTPPFPVTTQ
jgi:hypothetical protein